jgi:diaminopimelate epimerase
MGRPRFEWDAVPLAIAMDTRDMPVGWGMLERPVALSMGNPHIVFLVDNPEAVPLETLGPEIAEDPLFPEGVNVGVASVRAADAISLRVWERGAGLTPACGSGACAAFAAARQRRLVDAAVSVTMPGGTLAISEREGGAILMGGPVELVFRGEVVL